MSGIPKGSILEEVSPYAVVPLYSDAVTPSRVSKSRRVGTDPTLVPGLEDLPKWKVCPIWNHKNHGNSILQTPEMKKFLRRARRTASSSADTVFASWKILCILAILRVVVDNAHNEKETLDSTQQSTCEKESETQWWSALVSEHYDEEKERSLIPNDEDDDDGSLLVELWPLIREHIPWVACQRLYHRIQNRLHVLTISHPLKSWAQKSLFELTNDEFETSWKIFQNEKSETSSPTPNRLLASKLWLDRVANIPDRLVGVLIDDPSEIICEKEPKSDFSALTFPRCYQSCLPNTCLELHVDTDMEKSLEPVAAEQSNNAEILCRWIALYDLSSIESQNANRTLSTMPKPPECDFFDANGSAKTPLPEITSTNLAQAQRLAHSHFFKEAFGDAMSLYQKCHDYCKSSSNDIDTATKETKEWKRQAEADLWHAMGAVILSQQKFARAQEHWKNGSRYQDMHKEISEQLEKQRAYQYFDPLVVPSPKKSFKQKILQSQSNPKSQSIYVTSGVIETETCNELIAWAKEYALDNGGWTASRHYAVPTTDLPIHKVPKLLGWFEEWMPKVLFPLLQDQFCASGDSKKRFYVHDAFLVRYEATASSCFLPLHFDESTHSVVLALNDDFEGGGSYIYDLDQAVAPEKGGMVSFLGNQCLHGGNPVTRGVRYILAIFLFLDRDLAHGPGHEEENIIGETNGTKRREGTRSNESILSNKRPKNNNEEEVRAESSDKGGGFSFSFF